MSTEYKIIRDSIHGNIRFEGISLDLLDTPELQRLSSIKQLGLAHLVFPGAHHTRLEHSLGAFHMACLIADTLELPEDEKQLVTCAALLHDIGHGPFSHTLESILRTSLNVDHVDLTQKLISGEYNIFQEDEKQRAGKNSPARLGTCAPTLYFKASRWVIPWPLSRLKICSEAANPGAPFRLQGGGHNRDPRPTDFFVLQFISRQRSLRQSFLYPARILRQQFNFIKYLTGGQRSQDAFADYLPFLHQVLNVRFFRPGLVIMNTFTVIIMKWFTLVEEIKTHESNVHFFRSRHSHS